MKQKVSLTKHLRQKGQSLVETALVLPVMIILIAGAVEVSNILITKNRIESAARAAARFAAQGGDDVQKAALNSVTSTLSLEEGVWDIWLVEGAIGSDGLTFEEWEADGDKNDTITNTQIYGAITPTMMYTDIVRIIGEECISDPETIDLDNPQGNKCIRDQVLADLQRDVPGVGTPQTSDLTNLRIVGIYISHDIQSILGLNAFPAFSGILSVNGFSVMRLPDKNEGGIIVSDGCDFAMPIGVDRGIRSLNETQFNEIKDIVGFDYPTFPPVWGDFPNNVGDQTLNDAKEGYIYQLTDNDHRYIWLKWNKNVPNGNITLANSLTMPGDVFDPVSGFIEPTDATDQDLHISDNVLLNESATMSGVEAQLRDHIDTGRDLSLIVVPASDGELPPPRPDGLYHSIDDFAIFKIHGYNAGEKWMLVEFIGWNKSCGQVP